MVRKKRQNATPRGAAAKPPRTPRSHANDFLYRKIADALRAKLKSGAIAPGARLPSLNALAAEWGANRLTAMRAVEELRAAGLVFSVRARGTFAAGRLEEGESAGARAFTVGLLSRVLNPAGYGIYHQAMISGLCDGLEPLGANLLVLAAGAENPEDIPGVMLRARADAMVYMGAFEPEMLSEMLRRGPPAVVLDFDAGDLPVDGIRADNVKIGRLAAGMLIDAGIAPEETAILEGTPGDLSSMRRLEGAAGAFRDAGADFSRVRREVGWFFREGGRAAMRTILSRGGEPPRGVYCMNDEMASGALDALREAGLRVPEDVLLVGTDDSLWARTSVPQLSTVRIDVRRMGGRAVKLLFDRIADPEAPFAREVLAPEPVRRASCPVGAARPGGGR